MPIVTPPFYEPSRTFEFSTAEGLQVSVAFDKRVTGIPGSTPALPMRCADNPLLLSMQTFDEGYSPIVALSAELRFYWDADTNLSTFLNASSHSTGYPYWRAIMSIYDSAANLIFQRYFQVSERDFIEEITDREHVVTLQLYDGLASLKGVKFKTNLDSWENCVVYDKNMTIFDVIGWCVSQAKFSNNTFWLVDNLSYEDTDFNPDYPYLTQIYVNPESFANAEGETQDSYTVLENILKDNYLELRPMNMGGYLLIRKSDYCRLDIQAACWKIVYNGTSPANVYPHGSITNAELLHHNIVKDGDIGEGGRGHSSPVDHYMMQTVTKPISSTSTIANYRNIFTTFPNEFMLEGTLIGAVGGISEYDFDCWQWRLINTGTAAISTPAGHYARRFEEKDAFGQIIFNVIHFNNVGAGSSSAIAQCMMSPMLTLTKGMALKLRWEHTHSPEVTTGIQQMVAILYQPMGSVGGWLQDDLITTSNTIFNAFTSDGTSIGQPKGRWGLSTGALEPYYEYTLELLPVVEETVFVTLFIIGQRLDAKIKDFRVEAEYYYAGQDSRRIDGQSSAVSRSGVAAGGDTDTITQFDSPFYDAAGAMYLKDSGDFHLPTKWKWFRQGYTADSGALKSYTHQYGLARLTDDRRFLRRNEGMFYGLYVPNADPTLSSILGFHVEADLRNNFRLFRFLDRPTPEDTRYYCLTSFSDYNLKLGTVNILLTEVYCTTTLQEIDPNALTVTERFRILYNGDKTNIDRASMETKNKQISQGKGWWWLFGPLGYVIWGRKRKIQ